MSERDARIAEIRNLCERDWLCDNEAGNRAYGIRLLEEILIELRRQGRVKADDRREP